MRSKNKILFIKIFGCFLVVIFVLATLFGSVLLGNIKRTHEQARDVLKADFENGAEDVSRLLSQVKYSMSELSSELDSDAGFKNGSYTKSDKVRALMREIFVDRRQNEFSGYLSSLFIVDASLGEKEIYEITDTFKSGSFYNQVFFSDVYTEEFWLTKLNGGETFEIFPAATYSTARDAKRVDLKLLPVTYKPKSDSGYLIVMLVDIETLSEDFGISGLESKNGELLYCSEKAVSRIDGKFVAADGAEKWDAFEFADEKNGGIKIFTIVENAAITEELGVMNVITSILFVLLVCFAIAFAIIFSKRIVRAFADTEETLVANALVRAQFENGLNTVKDVFSAVKIVALQERGGASAGKTGESVLDSMLLQAHMRDVYAGIDDIEAQVNTSKAYFMAYFKISYMKDFNSSMKDDIGKATFLLKQLIEMYLETWGVSAVTFQTEKDGIVSVFDAVAELSPQRIVDDILEKLSNESEYAYFTVSVSDVHDGEDDIKKVYEILVDTAKYGRPVTENQVLTENQGMGGVSRFYFSVEEMGKFSAILQNGTEEEAIRKVDEILDYNLRKDINRFEMYLLCTEIVNCALKLINRVFYTIPQSVDISLVYRNLERATAPEDYRKVCVEFLHETIEYMKENKREDDYIISYIFDYVENHYSEDIYLNLFAEKLKLTGAYISSYFKEKTNVNLTDYINHYRIKKAVILSENPQNKNKDIAEMVGLPNINTFIRLFKKYTGYTPGEYRKKHFGEEENS